MAEEILDKFQAGDEGAFELLLGEYRPLVESQVKSAVRKSPELSAEYDELMQEAGMALYAAAKKYRKSAEVTFGLYAKICVRNRIVSFVRKINAAKRKSRALSDRISKANGKKHKRRFASDFGVTSGAKDASNCNDPSGATSEEQGSDPSGATSAEQRSDPSGATSAEQRSDPSGATSAGVVGKNSITAGKAMEILDREATRLEKQALMLYLGGLTYRQISVALETSEKSVDNAIFRAKRKLRKHFGMF